VLKIAGLPCFTIASSTGSLQKPTSMVMESCQARTFRLNQSTTASRLMMPHAVGM
jgi:hypothetical protein